MAEEQDPLRIGGPVNRGVGVEFDPAKSTTTMVQGAVGGAGETVIPWIITGSFDALPENIRGALVGYNRDGTARTLKDTAPSDIAAQRTTGYAIDPKSGEIILRQGEGGSARGGVAIDPTLGAEQARNLGLTSGMNVSYTQPASAGGISGFFGGFPGSGTLVSSDGSTTLTSSPSAVTVSSQPTAAQSKSLKAFDIFRGFLRQYGIEALAADVEKYKLDGLSDEELLIRLRTESAAYKRRFQANETRIQKGLRALSEAEYIGLEDQYQDVMRRYGLPESYYVRGDMGRQAGFEKFIAGDVSPIEVEDRIQTAQNRVLNAPPQIKDALTQFYGGDITNGDILAYVLDPEKILPEIKRKVTAAEIGGAATIAGLGATRARAEELGMFGVTGEQARAGYQTIAEFLPTAQKLGDIYAKQGMGPFTQTTAEQEVFGTTGAVEAASKRRKLTQLEQAQFSGQVGAAGGALARDRAGAFQAC